jgi:hypothetical protein
MSRQEVVQKLREAQQAIENGLPLDDSPQPAAQFLLLAQRVNPEVASELLGHRSVAIILDIYARAPGYAAKCCDRDTGRAIPPMENCRQICRQLAQTRRMRKEAISIDPEFFWVCW